METVKQLLIERDEELELWKGELKRIEHDMDFDSEDLKGYLDRINVLDDELKIVNEQNININTYNSDLSDK